MESFNGKYYTANNDSYTKEHNNIMDSLLWGYKRAYDSYPSNANIEYDDVNNYYYPISEYGAKVLEHLVDCDLISVVAD